LAAAAGVRVVAGFVTAAEAVVAVFTAVSGATAAIFAAFAAARSSARLGVLRTGSLTAFSTLRRQSLHETRAVSAELFRLDPVRPHATLPLEAE